MVFYSFCHAISCSYWTQGLNKFIRSVPSFDVVEPAKNLTPPHIWSPLGCYCVRNCSQGTIPLIKGDTDSTSPFHIGHRLFVISNLFCLRFLFVRNVFTLALQANLFTLLDIFWFHFGSWDPLLDVDPLYSSVDIIKHVPWLNDMHCWIIVISHSVPYAFVLRRGKKHHWSC